MTATAERPRKLLPWIGSHRLALLLGVSYRQLDYAVRSVPALRNAPTMSRGSGSRRVFFADQVMRLAIAAQLTAASEDHHQRGASKWIPAVQAVMAADEPPRRGIALWTPSGEVEFFTNRLVIGAGGDPGPVGVLIRYDIDLGADFGIDIAA